MTDIAIPEKYEIYMQDLSKQYIDLKPMGFVKTIEEAQTMCKVFAECDAETKKGLHTYLFRCVAMKGE